jgi:hypothetical protein
MGIANRWYVRGALTTVFFLCAPQSWAESPSAGNLLGLRGVLRSSAAVPQPSGYFGVGTEFQYFKAGDFLALNQDHSRLINTYALSWAVWRYLEASFAMHVVSDVNNPGATEELQVAVGDPEITLKGGGELGHGLAVGGILDLRFPSAAGFFQTSMSATTLYFAALASYVGSDHLPLSAHLNVGFLVDGTSNLFDDISKLTDAQRFSAQISSYYRFISRVSVEYNTTYVGPFLELSLEKFVGEGAPGFDRSPSQISFGLKGWVNKGRGLQLLAAMDIGLAGVGDGTGTAAGPVGKYAFVIPRWNMLFQLSYRFDPFVKPLEVTAEGGECIKEVEAAKRKEQTGTIFGIVLDKQTQKPIWNAKVTLEGESVSSLAVDPIDGTFHTFAVLLGRRTVTAMADGYEPTKLEVEVSEANQPRVTLSLSPRLTKIPGTLRGTIKSVTGTKIANATVLIPEVDKTIQAGPDGEFNINLDPGEYKIVVSAQGFKTQNKVIHIKEGSTVILNMDLYK